MDVDKPEKSTATASASADSKAPKRFEVKKVSLVLVIARADRR